MRTKENKKPPIVKTPGKDPSPEAMNGLLWLESMLSGLVAQAVHVCKLLVPETSRTVQHPKAVDDNIETLSQRRAPDPISRQASRSGI